MRMRVLAALWGSGKLATKCRHAHSRSIMETNVVVCLDSILIKKRLTRHQLAIPCPTDLCNELAMKLDSWELLAPFIGLSEGDCIAIQKNNSIYELQRLAMIRKWENMNGSGATYLKLALGLENIQRFDLVEYLCTRTPRVCHDSGPVKRKRGRGM